MAFNVEFYKLNKRRNSTLKPSGAGGVYACVLKSPTDIINPTIELKTSKSVIDFNYAKIDDFGRYYYCGSWVSVSNDIWRCTLTCDILASWIDEVKGQSVYARRTSAHFDTQLDDARVVPVNTISEALSVGDIDLFSENTTTFANVVDTGSATGCRVFYGVALQSYFSKIFDQSWYEDLFDTVRGFDPFNVLNEVWLSPLSPSKCNTNLGGGVANFGSLIEGVTISGSCINLPSNSINHTLTLPFPTLNNPYTDFRKSDKYMSYQLKLPFVGVINIPVAATLGSTGVVIDYGGDCLSGAIYYSVRLNGLGESLGSYGASLKAPLALSRQTANVAGIVNGVMEIGAGIAAIATGTETVAAMGASMAARGAMDSVSSAIQAPKISSTGGVTGSLVSLASESKQAWLYAGKLASDIEPSNLTAVCGRPTERVVTISGGYYECVNASVQFSGNANEINAFNQMLNGGVYVE